MRTIKPLDTNGAIFLTDLQAVLEDLARQGVLEGLGLANNATDAVNDFDVAAGRARSGNGNKDKLLELTATHVKQLDVAFAEYVSLGTPSGGRDSNDDLVGAKWFNVFLIGGDGKDDQAFASTSEAPTLPSGFTDSTYIGSLYWDGSTIKAFTMGVGGDPDRVEWMTPVLDVDATNPGATRQTPLVTAPKSILGIFRGGLISAATDAAVLWVGATTEADAAPSKTASPLAIAEVAAGEDHFFGPIEIPVGGSGNIGYRLDASTANITVRILTVGYRDRRRRP